MIAVLWLVAAGAQEATIELQRHAPPDIVSLRFVDERRFRLEGWADLPDAEGWVRPDGHATAVVRGARGDVVLDGVPEGDTFRFTSRLPNLEAVRLQLTTPCPVGAMPDWRGLPDAGEAWVTGDDCQRVPDGWAAVVYAPTAEVPGTLRVGRELWFEPDEGRPIDLHPAALSGMPDGQLDAVLQLHADGTPGWVVVPGPDGRPQIHPLGANPPAPSPAADLPSRVVLTVSRGTTLVFDDGHWTLARDRGATTVHAERTRHRVDTLEVVFGTWATVTLTRDGGWPTNRASLAAALELSHPPATIRIDDGPERRLRRRRHGGAADR